MAYSLGMQENWELLVEERQRVHHIRVHVHVYIHEMVHIFCIC